MDHQQLIIMANKFQSVFDASTLNERGGQLEFANANVRLRRFDSVFRWSPPWLRRRSKALPICSVSQRSLGH